MPELFSVWEKEGWEEPLIEERYGEAARTTLVLSFKKKATLKSDNKKATIKSGNKKVTLKTQLQLQEIQNKLKVDQEYKLEEIGELIGLKRSRTRDLVKKLVAMDIVVELGDRKSRRYKKIQNE